jgi:hypothetical protein
MRLVNFIYVDDFKAGFYFYTPSPGDTISISLFSPYTIPTFSNLEDLCNILNSSTHPGISLFNYSLLNGTDIHAQAKFISKELYHTITYSGTITGDAHTYFTPLNVFSQKLIDYLTLNYPNFREENLFPFAKTSDMLSGSIQDANYWVNSNYWYFNNDQQTGFIPTVIDQNVLNYNDIKLFNETFNIPENSIVFFVVNNLDGKNDFIWSLTNTITGEEIIRVKSVPFFIWKFKDIGNFSLNVIVEDNRKTLYENRVQNFIHVLNKQSYTLNVEERLNSRKNRLLKK